VDYSVSVAFKCRTVGMPGLFKSSALAVCFGYGKRLQKISHS
jgi:hypothetical protein